MESNIQNLKMKKRCLILVQSYPALRLVYYLMSKNKKIIIITSDPGVKELCNLLKRPCILILPIKLDGLILNSLPLFIKRNIQNYLMFLTSKKVLNRLSEQKEIDFFITIAGMDRKILPAFLNLKKNFFFWDDSFYTEHQVCNNLSIIKKIKNIFLNFSYNTRYSLFNDESVKYFPWTKPEHMPKNCINLFGNLKNSFENKNIFKNIEHKIFEIVILGERDFFVFSRKCNIVKLIKLIKKLQLRYPNLVYYKPHPGSTDNYHKNLFKENEIRDFIPIELISDSCIVVLTLGSAAVLELTKPNITVLGIGKLVDMCDDLFPLSETQGIKHVDSELNLFLGIDDILVKNKNNN